MPADSFRTLAAPADFRWKIERSEFLGIALPCSSDEEFFDELHRAEKVHYDASHHCWAFRLFAGGTPRQRSSDAGEPSGTAGKPILSAIEGADLYDAGVIVVRWFGGVKLGTGGLSRAYRDTATETLRVADFSEQLLYESYEVEVPFESVGTIYRLLDPPHIALRGETFGEKNVFTIDVRRSRGEEIEKALAEKRLQFRRITLQ